MGSCCSQELAAQDGNAGRSGDETIKLLVLGAGESGKSTVMKQMRFLYGAGFTDYSDDERARFRILIHQNIIDAIEALCLGARVILPNDHAIFASPEYSMVCPASEEQMLTFRVDYPTLDQEEDKAYVAAIKALWSNQVMQQIYEKDRYLFKYPIVESTVPFLFRIDEVIDPVFKPTREDILRLRVRTSGIREERVFMHGKTFQVFDVGGQKNERRKWVKEFAGVACVIFVVALSEYDQVLFEDRGKNRMADSLDLFERTANDEAFSKSQIILFLNKCDLFLEKIQKVPINSIPDFQGFIPPVKVPNSPESKKHLQTPLLNAEVQSGNGKMTEARLSEVELVVMSEEDKVALYEAGIQYFLQKFRERDQIHSQIYTHVTCALDTSSIERVLNESKNIMTLNHLQDSGFLDDDDE